MIEQQSVVVVTDSTSDIPKALAEELGIVVVPLLVSFGTESFRDGIDLTPDEFIDRLVASEKLPTTSQPPSAAFEEVFREAIERGQDVVCVTISSALSGTFNAARLAAESVDPGRIRVVDSQSATMQLGLVVVATARVARQGAPLEEVEAATRSAMGRVQLVAVLQTLDYVHKGGRIGKAQQLVGTALGIKPILSVVDGVLVPVERVRTWKKAVARLTEMIRPTPSDIFVLHTRNMEDARALAETLQHTFPDTPIQIDSAGATITTYAGPGAVGIAVLYPD